MTPGGQLDAGKVQALFRELSDRLATAGVQAQLFVVGGAAMALAYDTSRLTRDVDALFVPSPEYLLAMKLHASRDERDLDDAAILFSRLGYTTAQDCIDLLTATYPTGQLLPHHRYLAEEVATRAQHQRETPIPDTDAAKHGRAQSRSDDGLDPFRDPWQRRPGPQRDGPRRSL